jgi:hypothetical protein
MDGSADRFLDLMHQFKDGNAAETQQATRGDHGSGSSWFISANSATAERMIGTILVVNGRQPGPSPGT